MSSLLIKILLLFVIVANKATALERYVVIAHADLVDVSRQVLINQVGVKEQGHNRGVEVTKYLASVGLKAGNPYCAAGQYWCFWQAAEELKLSKDLIPIARTGSTQIMYMDAKKRGERTDYNPSVDDLLFWRVDKNKGHVERVVEVKNAGWVRTVGFNTSSGNGSQRDGDGVYYRNRNIYHPVGRLTVRGLIGFNRL